jgi:hypothetical protein
MKIRRRLRMVARMAGRRSRWTAIDSRLMAIYDRRTAIVRWRMAIYDRWTPIKGTKRLSCWLERQCRLDLRPGP